jgi:hypothetical protein
MKKTELKENFKKYLETNDQRLFRDKIDPQLNEIFLAIRSGIDLRDAGFRDNLLQELKIHFLLRVTLNNIDEIRSLEGYTNRLFRNKMIDMFRIDKNYKKYVGRLQEAQYKTGESWNNDLRYSEEYPQSEHIIKTTSIYTKQIDEHEEK